MTVYSTRFAAGSVTTVGSTPFTVPAGSTAVIRDIGVWNDTGSASEVAVGVSVSGSPYAYITVVPSLANLTFFEWQGRQVLDAGNELYLFDASEGCLFMISGYLLDA